LLTDSLLYFAFVKPFSQTFSLLILLSITYSLLTCLVQHFVSHFAIYTFFLLCSVKLLLKLVFIT